MRLRVTNDTDEPIRIEPGQTIRLRGTEHKKRVLASRKSELVVTSHEEWSN